MYSPCKHLHLLYEVGGFHAAYENIVNITMMLAISLSASRVFLGEDTLCGSHISLGVDISRCASRVFLGVDIVTYLC
jgi:hypothetical protein